MMITDPASAVPFRSGVLSFVNLSLTFPVKSTTSLVFTLSSILVKVTSGPVVSTVTVIGLEDSLSLPNTFLAIAVIL